MPKILLDDGETTEFPVENRVFRAHEAGVAQLEGQSDARRVRVVVSTPSVDRGGDVIELDGIDLNNYLKNPVVLLQHRAEWAIAKCVELVKTNGRLEAVAEFPEPGVSPYADQTFGLIKAGILSAVSIGLNPVEWSFLNDKDPWAGVKYLKSEMLEFSFVAIPMNAEALILERSMGTPEQKAAALESLGALERLMKAAPAETPEAETLPPPETPLEEILSESQDENLSEGACKSFNEAEKMKQMRLREIEVLRLKVLV